MEKKRVWQEMTAESEDIKKNLPEDLSDLVVGSIYKDAEDILEKTVTKRKDYIDTTQRIDDIITSKYFAFPLMAALLGLIFWLSIQGAEYPSEFLFKLFINCQDYLTKGFQFLKAPAWLHGILVLGVYRTLAWVVAVMLPPMAIFFPLFTFFEDLGYLPRIAFNLDRFFKIAGAHGKQALTMAMGFGCNAAGVIACRIIDSPREKLIAILTNTFAPCNGRFPLLLTMAALLAGGLASSNYNSFLATSIVVAMVLVGIAITLIVSFFLSRTFLKGESSSFTLELPPYRRPQIGRILIRSFLDRTLFVLSRAVIVAAPAGAVTYLLANIYIGDASLISHIAAFLDPFGRLIGLDGFIVMAFIVALPANEIVIPILIMSYLSLGTMHEMASLQTMREIFSANGWNIITVLNTMLFSLLHFPCGTTLLTIKKEAGTKWAIFGTIMPTIVAILVCFIVARLASLLGIV